MGDYDKQLNDAPPKTGRKIDEDGNLVNVADILFNVYDENNNYLRGISIPNTAEGA